MPIYEYYCQACHGRFTHLARQYDAPPPPCPCCGNEGVERLVSAANVIHDSAVHQAELKQQAATVDDRDFQATAKFLQDSGRLADADGLYGSRAYKELIARRAAGATDNDLNDLVDDLVTATDQSDSADAAAAAVALSRQVDNRIGAEGPAEGHDHGRAIGAAKEASSVSEEDPSERQGGTGRSRRAARDLGWG